MIAVFVAVLAFLAWSVYLGALASIQAACPDINNVTGSINWTPIGLNRGEECSSALRYWWFLMAIEFALIAAVLLAGVTNKLHSTRIALTGFAAVCMLLYIDASNTSLDMFLAIPDNVYHNYQFYRLRTWCAGCILVAGFNGFLILALGITNDYELRKRAVVEATVEHKATV